MPENRFYTDLDLKEKSTVILNEKESHHLSRVMRKQKGDDVELINGRNVLALGHVSQIEKGQAVVEIDKIKTVAPPTQRIILAQAHTRPNSLDWIVEKCTELGAHEFWFYPAERSELRTIPPRIKERLHLIAISAMKQCGRLDLPLLEYKSSLSSFEKVEGMKYFGDLNKKALSFEKAYEPNILSLFFIGPESGFTLKEIQFLGGLGAKGVHLHHNTLRAETAACVALTLLTT